MNVLADALVHALAYLNAVSGDDDREDDDCQAMEVIADMLDRSSDAERRALMAAAARAVAAVSAAESGNHHLVSIHRDILEDFRERFPDLQSA